jgi:transcriptional regulator with XRE-family HTH domain
MPQVSKLKLPPLDLGPETLGQRLARLRKERGHTQAELAEKIGLIRGLISDYERDKRKPNYEMIIRLALALKITTDELLGLKKTMADNKKPNLKIQRRVNKIEQLPSGQQKALLKTIDTFIENLQLKKQAQQ